MQTFLPVADFAESARLLDSPRLGKQRVETLQVLRALELPDYGWVSHPVVRMWRGRTPALVAYGLAMVRVWRERGFADSTYTLIGEFAPDVVDASQEELAAAGLLPSWLGDPALHLSHRSNLLAKDPDFYRPRFAERFGPEPDDLPYVWPEPDDVPPAPEPEGVRVWVVRPRNHNELGACLAAGVVGLGTQSGIDVDATGLEPAELRALSKELTGRRPAKDLRQLSAFLDEVRPGDPVGAADRARRRACCSARSWGTTCSRAASCCRTAVRPAGTASSRGRRPAAGHPAGPAGAVLRRPRPGARARRLTAQRQPGSGTFCRRTWPRATSLPSSARVSTTCHSCSVRPCWIGSATTSRRPAVIGRRKSVLLLTPTANWPRSATAALAPMLAADSITVQ